MSSSVLISVIVPVYNVELYLRECVNSLLQQTYDNLEIILVDDGSTDSSGAICDEYTLLDSRIIVIHQKNKGLSGARNTGIKTASGLYICFVDSDDYVDKRFVETLFNGIINNNCLIGECHVNKFYDGDHLPNQEYSFTDVVISARDWLLESSLKDFYTCTTWNKIYDRQLFEGVSFPEGRNYEDESTTYKLVYKVDKVFRTYMRLYNYRIRDNSITTVSITPIALKNKLLSLKERYLFFQQKGEIHYAEFSCAKHCINLLSSAITYSHIIEESYDSFQRIVEEIKSYIVMIFKSRVVPFKYKLYIVLSYIRLRCKLYYERKS